MTQLDLQINRFFQGWHAYEYALGRHRASVLDFDFCSREGLDGPPMTFEHRFDVLDRLATLQADVQNASYLKNQAFLGQKLRGTAAYLRALEGEVIPIEDYLEAMMGFRPVYHDGEALAGMRMAVEGILSEMGLAFTEGGSQRYSTEYLRADLSSFEGELRAEATLWLQRLCEALALELPLSAEKSEGNQGGFSLEIVEEDAYWANWIDGSRETGIQLKANTHARIRYTTSSPISLAAHEIAGHAAHVLSLRRAEDLGWIDPCVLNLTVHSCEAYHMEGLAQAVVHLLGDYAALPAALRLREALSTYHQALINNAHLDLEFGGSIQQIYHDVLEASPFLVPLSVRSNLRDRRRSPLFRTYQFVYGPSRRHFLEARALTGPYRAAFLRLIYHSLLTPAQITAVVADLKAAQATGACRAWDGAFRGIL